MWANTKFSKNMISIINNYILQRQNSKHQSNFAAHWHVYLNGITRSIHLL